MRRFPFGWFADALTMWAPDEGGGGSAPGSSAAGGTQASPSSPAPASSAPAPSSPAPSTPSTAPSPAPTSAGGGAAAADPGGFRSIRDVARELGHDFGATVADDYTALQQLITRSNEARALQQQMAQMQELARHGQQYLQHAPEFQKFLQAQQQAQAAADAEKANWFKAPEWNPAWASFISKDAAGNLVPVQGAPPGIVDKYLAFVNHQRSFMEKLAQDPIGALRPGIEQVAQQIAEKIVAERLGGYQGQNFAQNFIQQHSGWLYQQGQNGQPASGADGQPLLSPAGQRFQQLVTEAQQLGITSGEARAKYAYNMLKAEIQTAQQTPAAQQATNQAQGNALAQQFLTQAAGSRPNASGGTAPPANPNTPAPVPNGQRMGTRQLYEMLLRNMEQQGFKQGQAVDLRVPG